MPTADLGQKMALLSGPRQSGKTTLARAVLARAHWTHAARYCNWDDDESRTRILRRECPRRGLVVFDELHKYTRWRNLLMGLYDQHHPRPADPGHRKRAARPLPARWRLPPGTLPPPPAAPAVAQGSRLPVPRPVGAGAVS